MIKCKYINPFRVEINFPRWVVGSPWIWVQMGIFWCSHYFKRCSQQQGEGVKHTLFSPSWRCRKREPERLVVEVIITSVAPNKVGFSASETLRRHFIIWNKCEDPDNEAPVYEGLRGIQMTETSAAWAELIAHPLCSRLGTGHGQSLNWSNEGPSAGVWDLLCFLSWKVGLCAPNVPMRVSITPEMTLLSWKELNLCYSLFLFFTSPSMTSVKLLLHKLLFKYFATTLLCNLRVFTWHKIVKSSILL